MNNIRDIANEINKKTINHEIGKLQEIRKELKNNKKISSKNIFSKRTIFNDKEYAFHDGGRKEIQYNIGFEDIEKKKYLRFGLAFSLQLSQELISIDIFNDKIYRFNLLLNNYSLFKDYKMWYFSNNRRSSTTNVHQITPDLVKEGNFIFFGKLIEFTEEINYQEILETFDKMLHIYIEIETIYDNNNTSVEKETPFNFIKTDYKLSTERFYSQKEAQKSFSVEIHHSYLQQTLYKYLVAKFKDENVSKENHIANNKIDIVVNNNNEFYFYEIKAAANPRACIREALGQILDYAYFYGEHAKKLYIVGEHKMNTQTKNYLNYLKNQFKLPLEYIAIEDITHLI